jgi:hypothetical protein
MKWTDEIVEEVRAVREAYAGQFDYDLKRMFEDLKEKEEKDPAPRAELRPLKPQRSHAWVESPIPSHSNRRHS